MIENKTESNENNESIFDYKWTVYEMIERAKKRLDENKSELIELEKEIREKKRKIPILEKQIEKDVHLISQLQKQKDKHKSYCSIEKYFFLSDLENKDKRRKKYWRDEKGKILSIYEVILKLEKKIKRNQKFLKRINKKLESNNPNIILMEEEIGKDQRLLKRLNSEKVKIRPFNFLELYCLE